MSVGVAQSCVSQGRRISDAISPNSSLEPFTARLHSLTGPESARAAAS